MNQSLFLQLDLPALMAATLAACLCALLGNFMVLRKSAMLGDAISHAVLPGIVLSFLILGTRNSYAMLAGAAVAGAITAALIELIRRYGKVESGAATGVVLCAMFALGVVLMERTARNVDLDADCVLYGALEGISWGAANQWAALSEWATWMAMPRQVVTLAVLYVVSLAIIVALYKVLRLVCFDAGLAASLGFRPGLIGLGLSALVAAAAVGAFEAVGSILVVSMLVCPPAAAAKLSTKLATRIVLSQVLAVVCAVGGYTLAVYAPRLWASPHAVSASGMMAVVGGLVLVVCVGVERLIAARSARSARTGRYDRA